jgi:hypothetical protein
MVNTPICGVGKQCGERRAAAHISPSENNHDLEPIEKALFAGYFLSIPVIPVDDRCRIGQHLNRVKPKMVNSKGYAGTAPQGPKRARGELQNGEHEREAARAGERRCQ